MWAATATATTDTSAEAARYMLLLLPMLRLRVLKQLVLSLPTVAAKRVLVQINPSFTSYCCCVVLFGEEDDIDVVRVL